VDKAMGNKAKNFGLIGLGVVAGVAASFQFSAYAQKDVGTPLPLDELRQLADVYGLIKSDYVEPVEDKKLLSEAIGGMVASLDPHSTYLDQKAYREMKESVQGKFVGVGIEVASEDGYVKIVAPIEDTPAHKAGIKSGDLITRIDNVPVRNISLDEAIKRMRGKAGSKVTLTIARRGEDKPWVLPIQRQEIVVASVKAKMIEPGYAWLRVSQFQENTIDELAKKAKALYAENPEIKGLVLDLRNDPGGLLPGAIGVSAAFLPQPEQLIVSTKGQLAGRLGLGLGVRRRRAAGLPARHHPGQPDLRQGLGADPAPAVGRHCRETDHGALLHAEGPPDPGHRHRAGPVRGRDRRRRRAGRAARARSRPAAPFGGGGREDARRQGPEGRTRGPAARDRATERPQAAGLRQQGRFPAGAGDQPLQGAAGAIGHGGAGCGEAGGAEGVAGGGDQAA
jgi:hypothetical protein